jgi:hypothetical protein
VPACPTVTNDERGDPRPTTLSTPSGDVTACASGSYQPQPPPPAPVVVVPPPPVPVVESISPSSGPSTGGTTVTLTGEDLSNVSTVVFGTQVASDVRDVSSTEVTAVSPPGTPGETVAVKASSPGGTSTPSSADMFTYTEVSKVGYIPLSSPTRICDTRSVTETGVSSNGGRDVLSQVSGQCANSGQAVTSGSPLVVQVAGLAGVPSTGVSAVVVNVTETGSPTGGYLSVYPTGAPTPETSNVNFSASQTVANLVMVGLGKGGSLTVAVGPKHASANVVVDLEGYYALAPKVGEGLYDPLSPARIVDTRCSVSKAPSYCSEEHLPSNNASLGPVSAGEPDVVQVTGDGGVPSTGVEAVVLNLTAVGYTQGGYLTVYPAGQAMPLASNLNFSPGEGAIANRVVVPVNSAGQIEIASDVFTDFLIDVSGYFTAPAGTGSQFTAESEPMRICDTRGPSELNGGTDVISGVSGVCDNSGQDLSAGNTMTVKVTGLAGVPADATAVVANVTVTGGTSNGYLTVYPGSGTPPVISDLNWIPGETVANLVVAKLSSSGTLTIYEGPPPTSTTGGKVNVIVDVLGWFAE